MLYNNNRDPEKLLRLIKDSLSKWESFAENEKKAEPLEPETIDSRYTVSLPEGGLELRVRTRVLGGYEETNDRWRKIFQNGLGRDNFWLSAAEHKALASGSIPESVKVRLARFHLVDGTRGEPPMWKRDEIRALELSLAENQIAGKVHLETDDGSRGFEAEIRGEIEVENQQVTRLDLVVLGEFWGEGRYTRGAPEGRFPLVVTLECSDGTDLADGIPPQGSRGWLDGYMKVSRD